VLIASRHGNRVELLGASILEWLAYGLAVFLIRRLPENDQRLAISRRRFAFHTHPKINLKIVAYSQK